MSNIPHPWEHSYPAGVTWRTPLATTTLTAALDRTAEVYGERIAIEYLGQEITFEALARSAKLFASTLTRMGVAPGSVVALYLPNTPYHPVALFGALWAGCRVVHLTPLDAHKELVHKLNDTGARVMVTMNALPMASMARTLADAGLLDRVFIGDDVRWSTSQDPIDAAVATDARFSSMTALLGDDPPMLPRAWPTLSVDNVALLQYTGGTTGTPKAAMLTHANLMSAASSFSLWLNPQPFAAPGRDRHLGVLPLFHIYALVGLLIRSVLMGETLILRPRFDVAQTLHDIEQKRITWFFAVPTMLIALAESPALTRHDLSSLRFCLSGGAPLPAEVSQRFEKLTGNRVAIGWGMTETCGAGTATNAPSVARQGSCIGQPLPGMIVQVVASDDPHRLLPPGEVGELRIQGANVTSGYLGRQTESAAAFVDGFLLTGDLGYMDESGQFYLVDRKKDLIISGGYNVYPRAVEEAIYEHPAVEEVLVAGVADDYRGEAAKAFIKLRAEHPEFTLEQLRTFLADKLGRHELPAALEFRDSLPRTAVGKLSKKDLSSVAEPASPESSP